MTPLDARLNHIAVARRSVLEDRGSLQTSHIDSWIERSWKRCLSKGYEPQTEVQFAQISSQDLRRVEVENHDLIRAAKPLMDKLGRAIANTNYFAILTNAQGIVIDANGPIDQTDKRIWVKLNEKLLPKGKTQANITISGAGQEVSISVQAFNPEDNNIKGFVESGGLIAIEAEHFSKNKEEGDRKWIKIDDYGLTLSGMRATAPANAPAATPKKDAPCLEYPLYLFTNGTIDITLITSPLLNIMPGRDIKFAISIDDETPQYVTNVPDKFKVHFSNPGWAQTVVNQARRSETKLSISKPGFHTLKVWMVDPGVVVEKIIINTGGLKPSYLGPKESYSKK